MVELRLNILATITPTLSPTIFKFLPKPFRNVCIRARAVLLSQKFADFDPVKKCEYCLLSPSSGKGKQNEETRIEEVPSGLCRHHNIQKE